MDRRPPAVAADIARGSRVRRSSTRGPCSCRTIPTSARRRSGWGSTITATGQAPGAERAGGVAARNISSRSSSCCRSPRTSSLSTRTAGIRRKCVGQRDVRVAVDARRPPRSRSGTPRRTRPSTWSTTPGPTSSPRRSRSRIRIGRSADRHLRRRQPRQEAADVPDHGRAVRRRARWRSSSLDVDRTFKPGRRRSARARHPGLPRLRRAEVRYWSRPSPETLHLRGRSTASK